VRLLMDRFPGTATELWTDEDTVEVQVPRERIVDVLRSLRDEPDFDFYFLADAAAVDYGPGNWLEVVYHLLSPRHPAWLRIRVRVERDNPLAPTVTGLWEGAMYHEREMYDMMGIVFEGNRDMRRIYMSPDYKSFPQRKDFVLPDDAADSSAAGINPLERPETWDLSRFSDTPHAVATTHPPSAERPEATGEGAEGGETEADKSRPR
jgi:NADH-quinone oxidoreductase subunit C